MIDYIVIYTLLFNYTVAHVAIATVNVFNANKNKPKLYWLHSLVMTVLAAFGGGIITPVILGAKPSIILSNDLALSVTAIVWFLVNYCGFDRILEWKPMKFLMNMLVALWRTNGTVNTVTLACNVLKPGKFLLFYHVFVVLIEDSKEYSNLNFYV